MTRWTPLATALLVATTWFGPANAETITEEEVREMVSHLIPIVEDMTDRTFVTLPSISVGNRRLIQGRMLASRPRLGPQVRQTTEPWEHERVNFQLQNAVAVYVYGDEHIYIVKERIEELFNQLQLEAAYLRPSLRCVLVHELVHALQHQYGLSPSFEDEATLRSVSALHEGHATLIENDYCLQREGPAIAQLSEALGNTDIIASLDPESPVAEYGYGQDLLRELQKRGGNASLWAALSVDRPPWTDIQAGVMSRYPDGWRAPLMPLVQDIGIAVGPQVEDQAASPLMTLLSALRGRLGKDLLPAHLAGRYLNAPIKRGSVDAFAFLFTEPGGANEVLKQRRNVVAAWRSRSVPFFSGRSREILSLKYGKLKKLQDEAGVQDTLSVQMKGSADAYVETWVATDHLLIGVAYSSDKAPIGPAEDVMMRMLKNLPQAPLGDGPLSAPLVNWMDSVEAKGEELVPAVSWQYLLDVAALSAEREGEDVCRSLFLEGLDDREPAERDSYAIAGYRCASLIGDEATGTALLKYLDRLDTSAGLDHARLLANSGRPTDALAVLERLKGGTGSQEEARIGFTIHLFLQLQRWEEAIALLDEHPGQNAEQRQSRTEMRMSAYVGSKQWKGVLELMPAIKSSRAEPDRNLADIELVALLEVGRWDPAFKLAQEGLAGPGVRYYAASVLYEKTQRTDPTIGILRSVCPQLDGEQRSQCRSFLKQLEQ